MDNKGLDVISGGEGQLIQSVDHYVAKAQRVRTQKAYKLGYLRFIEAGFSVPATPDDVCEFLAGAVFGPRGVRAMSTLRLWVSAIAYAHKKVGAISPTGHIRVEQTLIGIEAEHGRLPDRKAPLLRSDVLAMISVINECPSTRTEKARDVRDIAMILLGFAGAFRASELVGLKVSQLDFLSRQREGLIVKLGQTKTRGAAEGHEIGIPYGRRDVCPVRSLKAWLDVADVYGGYVFRGVYRGGRIGDAMSTVAYRTMLKKRAAAAGLVSDDKSGHSLRTGFVTSALDAGEQRELVKQQGGWKSDAMLDVYYRSAKLFSVNMF